MIEFTFATPDDQRRRGEYQKFVFRNAMRGLMPESVLGRLDKADFLAVAIVSCGISMTREFWSRRG